MSFPHDVRVLREQRVCFHLDLDLDSLPLVIDTTRYLLCITDPDFYSGRNADQALH